MPPPKNSHKYDKIRVNLIINNRVGGNAPLIAQKIADRLQSEKQGFDSIEPRNWSDEYLKSCFRRLL